MKDDNEVPSIPMWEMYGRLEDRLAAMDETEKKTWCSNNTEEITEVVLAANNMRGFCSKPKLKHTPGYPMADYYDDRCGTCSGCRLDKAMKALEAK